jgi:16S rRNA (uracil1498-N3)-methyltransferase
MIGPEGDFSQAEVKQIIAKGGKVVSLSNNRLRTETAGIVAVCSVRL